MIPLNRWADQASNAIDVGKKNVSGQKEKARAEKSEQTALDLVKKLEKQLADAGLPRRLLPMS